MGSGEGEEEEVGMGDGGRGSVVEVGRISRHEPKCLEHCLFILPFYLASAFRKYKLDCLDSLCPAVPKHELLAILSQ